MGPSRVDYIPLEKAANGLRFSRSAERCRRETRVRRKLPKATTRCSVANTGLQYYCERSEAVSCRVRSASATTLSHNDTETYILLIFATEQLIGAISTISLSLLQGCGPKQSSSSEMRLHHHGPLLRYDVVELHGS
ncbi:MAG: hypothetical protein QXT73_06215 [Candidatus Methanomethylicaceae archaeon]